MVCFFQNFVWLKKFSLLGVSAWAMIWDHSLSDYKKRGNQWWWQNKFDIKKCWCYTLENKQKVHTNQNYFSREVTKRLKLMFLMVSYESLLSAFELNILERLQHNIICQSVNRFLLKIYSWVLVNINTFIANSQ